jgi:hypothetical protein
LAESFAGASAVASVVADASVDMLNAERSEAKAGLPRTAARTGATRPTPLNAAASAGSARSSAHMRIVLDYHAAVQMRSKFSKIRLQWWQTARLHPFIAVVLPSVAAVPAAARAREWLADQTTLTHSEEEGAPDGNFESRVLCTIIIVIKTMMAITTSPPQYKD